MGTNEQMISLGDQVQAVIESSGVDVYGFVLLTRSGAVEYRENVGFDTFKRKLVEAAERL